MSLGPAFIAVDARVKAGRATASELDVRGYSALLSTNSSRQGFFLVGRCVKPKDSKMYCDEWPVALTRIGELSASTKCHKQIVSSFGTRCDLGG
jgi:hypothetical protein